jgi:hypothetical protein
LEIFGISKKLGDIAAATILRQRQSLKHYQMTELQKKNT